MAKNNLFLSVRLTGNQWGPRDTFEDAASAHYQRLCVMIAELLMGPGGSFLGELRGISFQIKGGNGPPQSAEISYVYRDGAERGRVGELCASGFLRPLSPEEAKTTEAIREFVVGEYGASVAVVAHAVEKPEDYVEKLLRRLVEEGRLRCTQDRKKPTNIFDLYWSPTAL